MSIDKAPEYDLLCFPRRRGAIRALLIVMMECLALSSFAQRDVWLGAILQLLTLLVVSVDVLDRRLPDAGQQQRRRADCPSRSSSSRTSADNLRRFDS